MIGNHMTSSKFKNEAGESIPGLGDSATCDSSAAELGESMPPASESLSASARASSPGTAIPDARPTISDREPDADEGAFNSSESGSISPDEELMRHLFSIC